MTFLRDSVYRKLLKSVHFSLSFFKNQGVIAFLKHGVDVQRGVTAREKYVVWRGCGVGVVCPVFERRLDFWATLITFRRYCLDLGYLINGVGIIGLLRKRIAVADDDISSAEMTLESTSQLRRC